MRRQRRNRQRPERGHSARVNFAPFWPEEPRAAVSSVQFIEFSDVFSPILCAFSPNHAAAPPFSRRRSGEAFVGAICSFASAPTSPRGRRCMTSDRLGSRSAARPARSEASRHVTSEAAPSGARRLRNSPLRHSRRRRLAIPQNFMRSLCPKAEIRIAPLCALRAYPDALSIRRPNMLDLVYVALGGVLFVLMGLYARACGRL